MLTSVSLVEIRVHVVSRRINKGDHKDESYSKKTSHDDNWDSSHTQFVPLPLVELELAKDHWVQVRGKDAELGSEEKQAKTDEQKHDHSWPKIWSAVSRIWLSDERNPINEYCDDYQTRQED